MRTPLPTIVCLCGSTRFYNEFMKANFEETMRGKIVLSVGFFIHSSGANSPQFDCAVLKHVFKREAIDCPWHFRQERDLRTALHIAKIPRSNDRPDGFREHQADHDAAFQAMQIQRAFSM